MIYRIKDDNLFLTHYTIYININIFDNTIHKKICILKGICYSLFVNTRTQLNLNKIVIGKQYVTNQKNLMILHQSEKEQEIVSTDLKIILTRRSSYN